MRFLRAVLYLIITAMSAVTLSMSFCEFEANKRDEYVRNSLAKYGISVKDTAYAKDTVSIFINTNEEHVVTDDIMTIRTLLNALRCEVFEQNIYNVTLVSPSGKSVYSTMFYNIYSSSDQVLTQYSGGTYDDVMKKYIIKYDLRKNGYSCKYIGFYDTVGMEYPALYTEIEASPEDLAAAVSDFISSVTNLNEQGAAIFRYSAVFCCEDDVMAIVSRDILYGDVIYWKAPDYAEIKTMFG